jgi:hypothetical protein
MTSSCYIPHSMFISWCQKYSGPGNVTGEIERAIPGRVHVGQSNRSSSSMIIARWVARTD